MSEPPFIIALQQLVAHWRDMADCWSPLKHTNDYVRGHEKGEEYRLKTCADQLEDILDNAAKLG